MRDKQKADSGNFGRWRREDGEAVNGSGTNGAYIVIFLTALYPHSDEKLQKEDWMNGLAWFTFHEALDEIEYEDIGKLILLAMKRIRQENL